MIKVSLKLRKVATVFACLTVFSIVFLACNKDKEGSKDKDPDTEVPALLTIQKGLTYTDVLTNLTANGYTFSEKTDTSISFKGANLQGIHPLADFITDYVIDTSKQVTFAFNEEGLYMLKFEGKCPTNAAKSSTRFKTANFSSFLEDTKDFVREQYESMQAWSVSYACGSPVPVGDNRCALNHPIGDWNVQRLACKDGNIYVSSWYAESPNVKERGVILWYLLIPGNVTTTAQVTHPNPNVKMVIELFECFVMNYTDLIVDQISRNNNSWPCWHEAK